MSVAARWAGWQRRLGAPSPAPLGASLAGLPFLTNVFGPDARLLVEAAFGADLGGDPGHWPWYDITADLRQADQQRIVISPMGRSDEASQAQPAGCTFQLRNQIGDYSRGPQSKWYPYIRRNTPIRVRLTVDGSSWYTRFLGYANGFKPAWDPSARAAFVIVSASGILRRLQARKSTVGATALATASALARYYGGFADPLPVAYWPLEVVPGAAPTPFALSGLPGGQTAYFYDITTSAGIPWNTQAVTGPAGSGSLVEWGGPDAVTVGADIPLSFTTSTGWSVDVSMKVATDTDVAVDSPTPWGLTITGGTYNSVLFTVNSDHAAPIAAQVLIRNASSGAATIACETGDIVADGRWHHWRMSANERSGPVIDFVIYRDGVQVAGATVSGTLGTPISFRPSPDFNYSNHSFQHGQLAVFATAFAPPAAAYDAFTGHDGETAVARLIRVCLEEGVPLDVVDDPNVPSLAMGPQTPDTFVNLTRSCEKADIGFLHDGRGPGLSYISRAARYNADVALTLDMTAAQVGNPFAPVDDDQRVVNTFTVNRPSGGGVFVQVTGGQLGTDAIGVYDGSDTVNLDTTALPGYARWQVHVGTDDSAYRYPTLSLDPRRASSIAGSWLNTPLCGRIEAVNVDDVATQHPPGTVSLLLEGYTENLSPYTWTIGANCSPFAPWRVVELAADTGDLNEFVCHLDADDGAVTVSGSYPAGSTSITVNLLSTLASQRFSTTADDYPFDLAIGGWKVHCTAAAAVVGTLGAGGTQVLTVDPTPGPLTAGAEIHVWDPPVLAL